MPNEGWFRGRRLLPAVGLRRSALQSVVRRATRSQGGGTHELKIRPHCAPELPPT